MRLFATSSNGNDGNQLGGAMKTCSRILGLLAVLVAGQAFAQQDLAGTWQGKLAVDPTTSLTIEFLFTKKPDGAYSAVVNSPDNPAIRNVAATSVSYTGGALKVDVKELSGSYAGTLKDGRFDGKWTQAGSALPLALAPYQKPVLSKAAKDTLNGSWHGPLTIPGGKLTFVLRFKTDDKGELQGSLNVPEQGAVEFPMSDIELANNELKFKVPRVAGEYTGKVSNGAIEGAWKQGGAANPNPPLQVSLKKGEYTAPVVALSLSPEAFAAVGGKWQGTLQPPNAPKPLTIILRIEKNAAGQVVGFFDSPDQGTKGIPVGEASFAANKLALKLPALRAEFAADLAGKELKGNWAQGPNTLPLTLTKQ
jgi:hypothetical protein